MKIIKGFAKENKMVVAAPTTSTQRPRSRLALKPRFVSYLQHKWSTDIVPGGKVSFTLIRIMVARHKLFFRKTKEGNNKKYHYIFL